MESDLKEFERLCRKHGLALTVQRRIIYSTILDRRDHPTADQVYDAVSEDLPDVSRTTVYRVLETFVRCGLITKACHPGAAARYDPITARHHHLVCIRCEKVLDLDDSGVDVVRLPRIEAGNFEITDYRVHFRGICGDCRSGEKTFSKQIAPVNETSNGKKRRQ